MTIEIDAEDTLEIVCEGARWRISVWEGEEGHAVDGRSMWLSDEQMEQLQSAIATCLAEKRRLTRG